jgi:hypothetical protein
VRRNVSPCVLSCTGYRNLNLIRATTWNGQDSTLRRTERERHERRLSHLKQSLIASAPASFETAAYRLSGRSPIRHGGLDWDNYRPALLSLMVLKWWDMTEQPEVLRIRLRQIGWEKWDTDGFNRFDTGAWQGANLDEHDRHPFMSLVF